jgi:hypothetical protein
MVDNSKTVTNLQQYGVFFTELAKALKDADGRDNQAIKEY